MNITGTQATSVEIATPAAHGTASTSGTTISYTPASDYAGTDSFTYTASNDAGTSAPATVTITVDDPPLKDFAFSTGSETPLVFSVVNGSVSSYTLAVAPTHGTIIFNANGSGTYTPNSGFSGTDEFQYDTSIHGNNTGTVTITVYPLTITLAPSTLPNATSGVLQRDPFREWRHGALYLRPCFRSDGARTDAGSERHS